MQIGNEPDIVLFFDCPEEVMVKRVLNRNEVRVSLSVVSRLSILVLIDFPSTFVFAQGRVDDNIETVKERLKVFRALSLPVVRHYSEKGKLYTV